MKKQVIQLAVSAALLSGSAMAQDAASTPADSQHDDTRTSVAPAATTAAATGDTAPIAEVVVTGSRVVRDGSQAPSPVTVISGEQLQLASPGPIGEALIQLPTFRGSQRPTSGNVASVGPGSGSFLNLRNLGAQRTLLLIDGRRAAPSALLGTTDTNLLPQELVKRVDIVTGGASAAYGSDAVSGVVNFILDTDYTGIKGELQGGTSTHGDGNSGKINLTGGTGFADGKGHVVFSGSYYDGQGINMPDRKWANQHWGLVPDATGMLRRVPNVNIGLATTGGLALGGPFNGMQFGPDGELMPFDPGTPVTPLNAIGGDGAWPYTNLQADVTTESLFAHAKYDVTDALQVFAEGTFAQAHNRYLQVQQYQIPGLNGPTIFSDNVFLPDSIKGLVGGLPAGSPIFLLGRLDTDLGSPATADALNDTVDAVAGFKFDAGNGWTVDGYYEHGQNRQRIRTENNVNHEHFYAAVDAVAGPDGSPVCRVSITNPGLYPGCQPLDLFGVGAPSQGAIDYVTGDASYVAKIKQDVVSASVRGEPFATWAGPVAVGFGAEYRREEVNQDSDAVSQQMNDATGILGFPGGYTVAPGGWLLTNAQPVNGHYDIREGFFEFLAPLAKDLPGLQALDLNGAVRLTDYSTSGNVTTWKIGLSWQPVDDLRLRATRSRDIRAPNISELFSGSSQGQTAVNDPVTGNPQAPTVTNAFGNPDLDPEKADTYTVGFVYQPSWLRGASASVDYYNIDMEGAIDTLTAQQTVDGCQSGSAVACANIDRDSNDAITRIRLPRLNLNAVKTSGIDVELGYRTVLSDWSPMLGGQLDLRAIASWLHEYRMEVPGAATIDRTGEVGLSNNPRWSGNLNATYQNGPWVAFVQERMIGDGHYDNTQITGRTIDDNHIGKVFYTDTTLAYTIGQARSFQIYLTINNLFDKDPPIAPQGSPIFFVTNFNLYDVMGRYFTAGVKFDL